MLTFRQKSAWGARIVDEAAVLPKTAEMYMARRTLSVKAASFAREPRSSRALFTRAVAVIAVVLLGLLLLPEVVGATEPIRVALVTMGPGDEMVTRFGHDALLVERAGAPDRVYNFGTYNAESRSPSRVLSGNLRYFLSVSRYGSTVKNYRRQNRGIVVQDLLLDPAEAEELARLLAENARPENSAYRYDFARDNCTTRVRDVLDRVTHGALRAIMKGASPYTFREHILRLTAPDPFVYFFFDLGLGAPADRTLDAWDDAFLPDRLAHYVAAAKRSGPEGTRPLAAPEHSVFRADRAPSLETPPLRAPWYALAGTLFGAALAFARRRRARIDRAAALLGASFALVAGVLGVLLVVLLLTNVNPLTHSNVNVLFCPPWALALVVPNVRRAFGRSVTKRSRWELVCFAGSLAGLLGMLLVGQDSSRAALLFVPAWFGAWVGSRISRDAL